MVTCRIHFKDDYFLDFDLYDSSLAGRWADEINKVNEMGIDIGEKTRFVNFPNSTRNYFEEITECVSIIKSEFPEIISFANVITKDNCTQDLLNQLHHVFEVYHGLFNKQDELPENNRMTPIVMKALSKLNTLIHTLEGVIRKEIPATRFNVTWYDKPPRQPLHEEDYDLFTVEEKWGQLYIGYIEIGKTLTDLTYDNDSWISLENAFIPLEYYSCDCIVRFKESTPEEHNKIKNDVRLYYESNKEFFDKYKHLSIGNLPIGIINDKFKNDDTINELSKHQFVKFFEII